MKKTADAVFKVGTIRPLYSNCLNAEWQGIFYLFLGKGYHHYGRFHRRQHMLQTLERHLQGSIF